MSFKDKKVLVAGGTGMIGIPLVEMLIERGAKVRIASLDDPSRAHPEAEFIQINLMSFDNCLQVCQSMDFVFNLLGVKGSPAVTTAKPANFFVPTILMDTQLMEAARQAEVEGFLFTSSVAVYSPAEVFYEDDVWQTFPSPNDRFAGWAKRMGELQAEAYKIQYGWQRIAIVRPANVYGAYDNFDRENAMVVPSLIKRAVDGENPLVIWGDGTPERDFVHARDVARGMIIAAENASCQPINLASGVGVSIKKLVETIVSNLDSKPEVVWDTSKPKGDQKRILDISKANAIGFQPKISLEEGVKEVMQWYAKNKDKISKRYDVFGS
jgi:GDP-L-fucose synthase